MKVSFGDPFPFPTMDPQSTVFVVPAQHWKQNRSRENPAQKRPERIAFYLIQIEGNPRPAQAGNIAVALNRVNPIERSTL
jgi:hypothetical protein